jgi:NADPH:quinone reductase
MRAAFYERTGPASEVLTIGELPTPAPGSNEVRVRIAWSGVNPSDVKARAGTRTKVLPYPRIIPHSDGSGVIDEVGEGVDPARIGERVWTWNAAWGRSDGTAAEYVAIPAHQAVALPSGVDLAVGACLGIPALTAFHAVAVDGGVKDKVVLIAGGAGAVGHYAIQFAGIAGARRIIATVSNDQKAGLARASGADGIVNYRTEDLARRCQELTAGVGVDRIIEVDLAANVVADLEILRPGGQIVVYGSGAGEMQVPFVPAILKMARFSFFIVYNLNEGDRRRAEFELTRFLVEGRLIHNIAARLPLDRIAEAHDLVEYGRAVGNVVIELPGVGPL